MVMRTRISGSITRIVLGGVSLGLGSSTGMSGERQPRERVLAAFYEEPRSSRSADFLASRAKLSPHDAYALCSIAVSFRVTQVVDIVRGGNAMIPKSQFSGAVLIVLPPLAKAGWV